MKPSRIRTWSMIAATGLAGLGGPLAAAERPKVVVELFTSQGCSSCPPANANLVKIANAPGVLTLSFSVTYWDYLGWKDVFGRQEYTDRQVVYEPALGKRGPFTPQMVFNGATTAIGHDLPEVQGFIADASALKGPDILLGRDSVEIGGQPAAAVDYDVWLVRYDPGVSEVPVGRGENAGTTMMQTHVVHALTLLGDWSGSVMRYRIKPAERGLKTAVLVQAKDGGPILAAANN